MHSHVKYLTKLSQFNFFVCVLEPHHFKDEICDVFLSKTSPQKRKKTQHSLASAALGIFQILHSIAFILKK